MEVGTNVGGNESIGEKAEGSEERTEALPNLQKEEDMNKRPLGRHTHTPQGGSMNVLTRHVIENHQPRLAAMQRSLMLNLVRGLEHMQVWIEALDMVELWGHKSLWEQLATKTRGDRNEFRERR